MPGDALQCVVIDKLPFPPPNDPLVEARVQRLEARGPQPVHRLLRRRGGGVAEAGRRPADPAAKPTAACWWCATRAWRPWATAAACCAALPPMTRVDDEAEALAWLRELAGAAHRARADAARRALTRASTTASCAARAGRRRGSRCRGSSLFSTRVGVVAQLGQAEPVVALHQDVQRFFGRRRAAGSPCTACCARLAAAT